MDFLPAILEPYHYMIAGLLIVTAIMLRLTIQRFRNNQERLRQREEARRTAQKTESKRQKETLYPKSKPQHIPARTPMADPFSAHFTGNIQGIAAKWEAEIHQIGRQIIGQLDSKMSALQAITLEANRAANRLDILVEHLESLAKHQIDQQDRPNRSELSAVIPASNPAPDAVPLNDVLRELADDLEGLHQSIQHNTAIDEKPEQAVILRLSEIQSQNIRNEVQMLSNYGLEPEEIARQLHISPGEVDLIQQIQQNQ